MTTGGYLALELASTVRHDGNGGVADDLTDLAGLADWVDAQRERLAAAGFTAAPTALATALADRETLAQVLAVRAALRALLARAVSPAPPSPADAHRLIPAEQAVLRLNAAAQREPVAPRLDWPAGAEPQARWQPVAVPAAAGEVAAGLGAALARTSIGFLTGPEVGRLRACTAPRCVRYFLQGHGRQEFCKPSCGNRARAARHYQRHHAGPQA
ncbi:MULTISPECIES: CGNR zinc finger domain-containing protein [Kitasatospora]|uniref:ABATE domain-containing protein n=1 Tax=Kitasatospora TaxID=2063 RepID=UPI000C7120C0|nr:CGNR zinc finger domain-containing protein [Kitasatospora sp. GP30]MDH6138400.1 putative RNA-binding Zn ribbon-like protein [Kitasatospora sp. GP30]